MMTKMVKRFKDLSDEYMGTAGGKGSMLARMYQSGYPVPDGFVVLPSAFQGEELKNDVQKEICSYLNTIRKKNRGAKFAVRSSALSEDSVTASFAGEFETVLNVKSDKKVLKAIITVFQSRESERVKAYSTVQGIEQEQQIAVVIQLMVPSDISGVLFTADPITGSFENMTGNYVHGLGEKLVSGEADAAEFRLSRLKGIYDGPDEFKKYAAKLYKYASRLEKEMGSPQDIEWAVAEGDLYILQSRPITTLSAGNLDTYQINESLVEDALWVNTNVGEAIPDVVTPLTWSIVRALDEESAFVPGYYLWSGNICGRIYSNISRRISAITALYGMDVKKAMELAGELFGQIPDDLNMPLYPFPRFKLIKQVLPRIWNLIKNVIKASIKMKQYLKDTPDRCREMAKIIKGINSKEELLAFWEDELRPYNIKAWWMHTAGSSKGIVAMNLNKKLTEMVGAEDANALLSNLREGSELASLGPVVGVAKVLKEEMSREEYLLKYGHRGPHEFELSIPDPAEDKNWLTEQIEEYKKSDTDIDGLLNRQHQEFEAARKRFREHYPKKVKWLEKKLKKAAKGAQAREAARSELVRVIRVNRSFALKAGELTGLSDDIFYLYIDEIESLLTGKEVGAKYIPARKENYQRYKELPPFPSIIRGRFNPEEWIKEPDRRMDYYDTTISTSTATSDSETLKGCAGAAGKIEGKVRILTNPEDGVKLQPGEILVATTTNVGWTPLFSKAAAVITDIGAPLSHAAIVARELGIPAVVGCSNATVRLKTGDKVMVDGGQGIVHLLEYKQEK